MITGYSRARITKMAQLLNLHENFSAPSVAEVMSSLSFICVATLVRLVSNTKL